MVTETENSADIGKEFGKVDDAAQLLYGYVKVPIGQKELSAVSSQLEILMSEVDSADHDVADELERGIYQFFQDHFDLPLDLKSDPETRFSGREIVREKIDQLAGLALKYSKFENDGENTGDSAAA